MSVSGKARRIRILPPRDEVDELLARVRPSQDRLDLARDLPDGLRAHLRKTKRLATIAPHTRLAGSYGRHVSTHQIKDVDVVIFIDPRYRAAGTRSALQDLEDAVTVFQHRRRSGAIDRRAQRRSVRVAFNEDDFYIDLVPALAPAGPEAVLEIPDRDRARWVRTASVGYGAALSDRNRTCDGKLVPLIQLLRHWALMRCADVRVKGFWLEALIVHLVDAKHVVVDGRSILEIFADAIDAMYAYCSRAKNAKRVAAVPDPVLGTNVAALWSKDEFDAFFARLREAQAAVVRARSAQDMPGSVAAWQELFGDQYLTTRAGSVGVGGWLPGLSVAAAVVVGIVLLGRKR